MLYYRFARSVPLKNFELKVWRDSGSSSATPDNIGFEHLKDTVDALPRHMSTFTLDVYIDQNMEGIVGVCDALFERLVNKLQHFEVKAEKAEGGSRGVDRSFKFQFVEKGTHIEEKLLRG